MNDKYIFLDYDGVVNTPIWNERGRCCFNWPKDGKVNNYQAIMWLNELCRLTKAKIIVSSTWRYTCHEVSYQDCLYNAGLNKNIEIIGCTDWFGNETRTDEIKSYLSKHKEIRNYIILDDEDVDDPYFVKCNINYGFGIEEFYKAKTLLGIEEGNSNE